MFPESSTYLVFSRTPELALLPRILCGSLYRRCLLLPVLNATLLAVVRQYKRYLAIAECTGVSPARLCGERNEARWLTDRPLEVDLNANE